MRCDFYALDICVFRCCLNCPKLVICLIVAGELFHTRGPATTKLLLSPRVIRMRGTECSVGR